MTDNSLTNYRIYHLKGQPMFAVPAKPACMKYVGLARYQPFTFKRALYRQIMHWLMTLHVDRLFYTNTPSPIVNQPDFDFQAWLNIIREQLNDQQLQTVIFWPPQIERGRIYVHLIDAEMQPAGFAKIGFDDYDNRKIQCEAETLDSLNKQDLTYCQVPSVMTQGIFGDHRYLVVQPLPEAARPVEPVFSSYPAKAVSEYAGEHQHLTAQQLSDLAWWKDYQAQRTDQIQFFDAQLQDLLADGFHACRVHGDFSAGNIVDDNRKPWIFDWEESCRLGPILADEIGFFLSINFVRTLADPIAGLRRLEGDYLKDYNARRRLDVMLALALRSTTGMKDAVLLMENWKHIS